MKKIMYKLKKLLSNVARTIFVIVLISLASMAIAVLTLPALTIGIPVIAILDAFAMRESAVVMILEYESAFIKGIAEGLNDFGTKLSN